MIDRMISFFDLRRSTAHLLARSDDHLLADIGLTRGDLEAMHLGLRPAQPARAQVPTLALRGLARA